MSNRIFDIAKSKPFKYAIGSWSFFILENVVLSENRSTLIKYLNDDEKKYRFLYSVCSTIGTGLIVVAYLKCRHTLPFREIKYPSKINLRLAFLLQSLGFIGLSQQLPKMQNPYVKVEKNSENPTGKAPMRCPFDFTKHEGIRGVERISRHYGLWSLSFIGLGSALITKSIPQATWFFMPTLMALIGGLHHDSRFKRGIGGKFKEEVNSGIPFVGLLFGKQDEGRIIAIKNMCMEIKVINLACGLGFSIILASVRRFRLIKLYKA